MVQSVLAAILESAGRSLQIGANDLDGVAYHDSVIPVFALFNNVPGGAGLVSAASDVAARVMAAAYSVAEGCKCGERSSCYGCLCNYRNQCAHELLNRTAAAETLAVFAVA